ncbi:hypothetical protein FLA_2896 [Filimonas lacunae]|nr:hypothetical protein FLA_2896 [Filimonas lacunae]
MVMLTVNAQEDFSMYCDALYPYVSFSYILQGNIIVRYKGNKDFFVMRENYCRPGFINTGKHQMHFRKGKTVLFYFIMETSFFEEMQMNIPLLYNLFYNWKLCAHQTELLQFRIDAAFERLIRELQSSTKTGIALETEVLSIIQALILCFEEKLKSGDSFINKPVSLIVHDVRDYIISTVAKGPRQDISIIASQYYIGEKTLSRVFRNTFGITLKQFKLSERMKVAAQMREQGTSLQEIAVKLGYSSVHNLQREYMKHFNYKLVD